MTFANTGHPWKDRWLAAVAHFGLSVAIAAACAALVFFVWYPYPYREISGGRELFLLVVAVDVVLGPLLTFAVFSRRKPWAELRLDLTVIFVLQLAALGYGLWAVFQARPVHLVFEYDRFRVVHAADLEPSLLAKAPAPFDTLPLLGPDVISLRPLQGNEKMEYTMAALGGVHLSMRPELWQDYKLSQSQVLKVAQPVDDLLKRFAPKAALIQDAVVDTRRAAASLRWVPMVGRKDSFWTVLVDAQTGAPLGYIPLDPY